MGWAKYFEDIQKLRDHAKSLCAENFDHDRASASPEKAIFELMRVKEAVFHWSEGLVEKLDEILEQATDPEIDRQLLIDQKDQEIKELKIQNKENATRIADIERNNAALKSQFFDLQTIKSNYEFNSKIQKETISSMERKLSDLESYIQKERARAQENSAFQNHMMKEGTRPLRR